MQVLTKNFRFSIAMYANLWYTEYRKIIRKDDMIMINYATPESRGVSSARIEEYIRHLENHHLAMHDVLIARGDDILAEIYYPPFAAGMPHRLYSVTKSFVALAVGFALDDGLLSLDDPMSKYFAEELTAQGEQNNAEYGLHMQTVRNMLMMSTAKSAQNWFAARSDDRVRFYFENTNPARKPGVFFEYDSPGTFVIGALIERLTGRKLMDYLREKLFDKIGVSDKPFALFCPGGHTWSDSAFLMPPTDLYRCLRFVANGGAWNGEQLISADFIKDATSALISTGNRVHMDENGYGYYIWRARGDGFYFNGMGCQFALYAPEKDLILVCNADNQGNGTAKDVILDGFYDIIVKHTVDVLPEDKNDRDSLAAYTATLQLFSAYGNTSSPMAEKISQRTYTLSENRMGIKWFTLTFHEDNGVFAYENAQGKKEIPFGICKNSFADFPEEGYSDTVGSERGARFYHGAYSAAWKDDSTFWLKVQLIDDYFGNMDAVFSFSDGGDAVELKMNKTAEDFLNEYYGSAVGHI